MKRTVLLATALLMGSATLAPASDHGQSGHHGHVQGEMTESRHEVRGIYLGYDAEAHRISVAQEEIPDGVRSMRMNLHLDEGDTVLELAEGALMLFIIEGRDGDGLAWYAEPVQEHPV